MRSLCGGPARVRIGWDYAPPEGCSSTHPPPAGSEAADPVQVLARRQAQGLPADRRGQLVELDMAEEMDRALAVHLYQERVDVGPAQLARALPPQRGNRQQAVRGEVVAFRQVEHEHLELVVGHAFSSLEWRGDHPDAQEGSRAHEAWTGDLVRRFA